MDFLRFVSAQSEEEIAIYRHLFQIFLKDLTPSENPLILAMGGAPGSGKTTWRKQHLSSVTNAHLHDMDEILIHLPKYQEDLASLGSQTAFTKWWPIARTMADKLVQYAIKSCYSIIYDRTCGAETSYYDLLMAKEKGYRIELTGFCVNRDIALERIALREKKEGRSMTKEIFDEYCARFSALWPYYLTFVDKATLYDTSVSDCPKIIFSDTSILDSEYYEDFLKEGEPFQAYFSEKLQSLPFK